MDGKLTVIELDRVEADSVFLFSTTAHERFDREVWRGNQDQKESFHNSFHLRAVWEAADKLLVSARRAWELKPSDGLYDTNLDPLRLNFQLDRWNEMHIGQSEITFDEFCLAVKLAVACHDLGNIIQGIRYLGTGDLEPNFLEKYTAKGAEGRSQIIAEELIRRTTMEDGSKKRLIPLVKHLIGETVFLGSSEPPFAVFMRVVDQVGNDLFSKNESRVLGLLREMQMENPQARFHPALFFNFVRQRFPQLVLDEGTRAGILAIWGKEMPPELKMLQEEVPVERWLNDHRLPLVLESSS